MCCTPSLDEDRRGRQRKNRQTQLTSKTSTVCVLTSRCDSDQSYDRQHDMLNMKKEKTDCQTMTHEKKKKKNYEGEWVRDAEHRAEDRQSESEDGCWCYSYGWAIKGKLCCRYINKVRGNVAVYDEQQHWGCSKHHFLSVSHSFSSRSHTLLTHSDWVTVWLSGVQEMLVNPTSIIHCCQLCSDRD